MSSEVSLSLKKDSMRLLLIYFCIAVCFLSVAGRYETAILDVRGTLASLRSVHAREFTRRNASESGLTVMHRSRVHHNDSILDVLGRDEARLAWISGKLQKAFGYSEDRVSSRGSAAPVTSGLRFGSGEYFVRMGVGTPPRQMYLVMDTGSDVPWIQCSPCQSCYKQYDAVFDPSKSSTFRKSSCASKECQQLDEKGCSTGNVCQYQVAYGDGSFTIGELATDQFSGKSFAFGCGHDNEGLFIGAAGLLGLGAGKLSFPSQLGSRKFSYCLVTRDNSVKASSELLFGESAIPSGASFAFTTLLRNPRLSTFYYASLVGISVGGSVLNIPKNTFRLSTSTGRGGVIVDSGTSVTRLPTVAYSALRDAFRAGTKNLPQADGFSLFDTCYDLSSLTSVTIPTVGLHFEGGASVQLPPGNYMVPVDSSGTYCFAFAKTSMELSIVGNIQQQTLRVAIDLDSSRIGFAPKQCT